jgi:hypothetical protein
VKYYTALHAINLLLWNFPSPIVYVILGYAPFEDKEMAKSFKASCTNGSTPYGKLKPTTM